jgi:PAS domain S-box-containing protein
MTELQQLQQELVRERHERQKAEVTLVTRSLELLQANEKLTEINNDLEVLVEKRTQQFNLLIDKSPMGMLTLDSSYQIIRINEKIQSIFEVSEEELIGLNFTEWAFTIEVDPDLIDHQAIGGERFVKLASGKRIYFETHFNQIQYDGVDYFLVVIQLINKRKEIIKKYEERDREYTELLENISDVIYKLNSDGYYTYINQNVLSLTGYTHEEFIGTHFTDIIEEPYRTSTVEFYVNQREKNIPSTYLELPIRAKNGDEVWVGQTVTIQHKKNGEVEFLSVCRDITSRKRMENAILRSEEKYRSIIENLELGLLEVDPNGIVIYAYPKFCELSGYEPHELIGQNAADILLSESAQRMMEEQMSKRIEGQSSVYEVELTRKDGEVRWVIISGAPYYNENNEIAGTVGIHLDITNRKLIEQELLQAKELAEASSKSKDLFMANMSHEIRTPLNAIVGMGSLLEETDLDDRQQRYLNAISSSSENLLAIVNDLLDFSKIGSGKMKLELVPSDLRNQLHVLMDIWEVRAESKGLYFEQYIDPAIQAAYLYDPTKLNGVLTNLLQNALKFTEKGGFSLSVIKKSNHQQKDILRFEVFDTGIGVAKEKQSDIFESFVQAENSTTRKYGGTGLGLAISKSMVEQMGGTLELDSELNKGSTLSLIHI